MREHTHELFQDRSLHGILGEQSLTRRTRANQLSITSSCSLLSCGTALKKALQDPVLLVTKVLTRAHGE